jgi:hypothetical protein
LKQRDKETLFNRYVVTNEQWFVLFNGLCEAQSVPNPDILLQAHITSLKTDLARLANERAELYRQLEAFPSVPEADELHDTRLNA